MSKHSAFTSDLGPLIVRYLALKEALGRRYNVERTTLAHLDRYLAAQPPERAELTAETFLLWATTLAHLTTTVRRNRMRIVRNLCLYRRRSEPSCYVPDRQTFPRPHQPRRPHLFTEQQITRLLRATDALNPRPTSPLYSEGLRIAIVLLYTSGLRRGELVRLRLDDYEREERTLRIRDTKFHKSRLVPLSKDAAHEMDRYLLARLQLPRVPGEPLLCTRHGRLRPYTGAGLAQALRRLFVQADIRMANGRVPRVHDMRHSFALHALLRWYRAGVDVQARIPALATYMGHASAVSTQHYLAFLEPFAEAANDRFARHCETFLTPTNPHGGIQ